MTSYLKENEIIEMEIHHKKHLPFRLEDWVRSFVFVGIIVAAVASIINDGFISIGTVFILVVLFLGILPLYIRWKKLQPLKYYITNERLIILNKVNNNVVYSFDYTNFPEIKLHENAYNSGYIIIGEVEPMFGSYGLFKTKTGVNLADHEIVLENIPDVRKIYDYLKSKIDNTHTTQ